MSSQDSYLGVPRHSYTHEYGADAQCDYTWTGTYGPERCGSQLADHIRLGWEPEPEPDPDPYRCRATAPDTLNRRQCEYDYAHDGPHGAIIAGEWAAWDELGRSWPRAQLKPAAHWPPSSADLAAMRHQLAERPRYADEREVLAAAVHAPASDPLRGTFPAGVSHLPAEAGDRWLIVMPAPDALPAEADTPYGVGAVEYTSAPAGAWWAWLTRAAAEHKHRAYWHGQPDGATEAELRRGLPRCRCIMSRGYDADGKALPWQHQPDCSTPGTLR